ncbi:MAG: hypothetical protein ACREBG_14395 [Pyrinomonadaceae bacterium]
MGDKLTERVIEILNERITPSLTGIRETQEVILAALDDLKAAVARNNSVQASATELMVGLRSKLDAAIANGSDPTELEALSKDLGAQTDALAAAVAKNTIADSQASNPVPATPVEEVPM